MGKPKVYDVRRNFGMPQGLEEMTLWDAFADVFTPPESLRMARLDYGYMARLRDLRRIGEDFRKAKARLGLEHSSAASLNHHDDGT